MVATDRAGNKLNLSPFGEWGASKSEFAPVHRLLGHNHLSPAVSLGSPERDVEELVAGFVARVTG